MPKAELNVPIFTWIDEYLLGVQEFDEHHQQLVKLLNASFDAFEANTHPRGLTPILDALVDYATYHFAAEESWMTEHEYPKTAEHAKQHEMFSAKLVELQQACITGKITLNADLFSFLADWLAAHILESDADYGRYATKASH